MGSRYGDIGSVDTTGASWQTGGNSSGVSASHAMAADDLPHVNKHKDKIKRASARHGVQPALVAGIMSRETRGGRGAGLHNGYGDNGNAYGLMQVDKRWHKPRGAWDSEEHIDQSIGIYKGCYSEIDRKFPHWSNNQKTKGALAAYNMGASSVQSYEGMDARTTGGDYANDVTARAQYYQRNGY